jgi:hypothetical protein
MSQVPPLASIFVLLMVNELVEEVEEVEEVDEIDEVEEVEEVEEIEEEEDEVEDKVFDVSIGPQEKREIIRVGLLEVDDKVDTSPTPPTPPTPSTPPIPSIPIPTPHRLSRNDPSKVIFLCPFLDSVLSTNIPPLLLAKLLICCTCICTCVGVGVGVGVDVGVGVGVGVGTGAGAVVVAVTARSSFAAPFVILPVSTPTPVSTPVLTFTSRVDSGTRLSFIAEVVDE